MCSVWSLSAFFLLLVATSLQEPCSPLYGMWSVCVWEGPQSKDFLSHHAACLLHLKFYCSVAFVCFLIYSGQHLIWICWVDTSITLVALLYKTFYFSSALYYPVKILSVKILYVRVTNHYFHLLILLVKNNLSSCFHPLYVLIAFKREIRRHLSNLNYTCGIS